MAGLFYHVNVGIFLHFLSNAVRETPAILLLHPEPLLLPLETGKETYSTNRKEGDSVKQCSDWSDSIRKWQVKIGTRIVPLGNI